MSQNWKSTFVLPPRASERRVAHFAHFRFTGYDPYGFAVFQHGRGDGDVYRIVYPGERGDTPCSAARPVPGSWSWLCTGRQNNRFLRYAV